MPCCILRGIPYNKNTAIIRENTVRLTHAQRIAIKGAIQQVAGKKAHPLLFGSRLDDNARGGDVDILLKVDTPVSRPARLIAEAGAAASIAIEGLKVDVVLVAPNLTQYPIHQVALRDGVAL